jgi:hypothetical protein
LQAVKDLGKPELRQEAWSWLEGAGGDLLAGLGFTVSVGDADELLRRLKAETTGGRKAAKQRAAEDDRLLAAMVASGGFAELRANDVVARLNVRGVGLEEREGSTSHTYRLRALRARLAAEGWELTEGWKLSERRGRASVFSLRRRDNRGE